MLFSVKLSGFMKTCQCTEFFTVMSTLPSAYYPVTSRNITRPAGVSGSIWLRPSTSRRLEECNQMWSQRSDAMDYEAMWWWLQLY